MSVQNLVCIADDVFFTRKSVHDPPTPGRVDDIKASPQGGGSPGAAVAQTDRSAAKRAELRRMEQERRRREAVS